MARGKASFRLFIANFFGEREKVFIYFTAGLVFISKHFSALSLSLPFEEKMYI